MVVYTLLYLKWSPARPTVPHRELGSVTWQCGWEFGGEWIQVCVWPSPFTVHLKPSQCCLLISYTPMQNKKLKRTAFTSLREIQTKYSHNYYHNYIIDSVRRKHFINETNAFGLHLFCNKNAIKKALSVKQIIVFCIVLPIELPAKNLHLPSDHHSHCQHTPKGVQGGDQE